jgi:hypothetical protein
VSWNKFHKNLPRDSFKIFFWKMWFYMKYIVNNRRWRILMSMYCILSAKINLFVRTLETGRKARSRIYHNCFLNIYVLNGVNVIFKRQYYTIFLVTEAIYKGWRTCWTLFVKGPNQGQFGYNWTNGFQSRGQKKESYRPKDPSSEAWAKLDQCFIEDVKSMKASLQTTDDKWWTLSG